MTGLLYQIKNIRRDKLCILTFLLPIIVGIALQLMSGISFTSLSANSFGILKGRLPDEAVEWLEDIGVVSQYDTMEELQQAVNEPSTQLIGVLADPESGPGSLHGIMTIRSGDELTLTATVADTLPKLYRERDMVSSFDKNIIPLEQNHDFLQSLLVVITLVTALFMGCTFNAMSIISEKEEGITYINQILPMKKVQYILQKIMLGFLGSIASTLATAFICIRLELQMLFPVLLLIVLSAFIAALTGLFIGHFSQGLMVGIVYIKIVMILFLALPVLCYLSSPAEGMIRTLSYLLPSSATFYGFMDLLNGQPHKLSSYLIVLVVHCFGLFLLYAALSVRGRRIKKIRPQFSF